MRKHLAETEAFIKDLLTVGEIYGFMAKVEHRLAKSGCISADLTWRVTENADPVVIIEVESARNSNMVQNAAKIFNSRVTMVKKPWFFFHIVYHGNAGCYAESLSKYKDYLMYHLFENVVLEDNKRDLVMTLHKCILSILSDVKFDVIWERFQKIGNTIEDALIRSVLQEQIVCTLNLPEEILTMVHKGQLTADQGKKLEEIKKIMHVSPEIAVNKMIYNFAKACAKNNWSLEEINQKLDNLKHSYIMDRFTFYNMNREHDKNIESTGKCFCMDLRRKEYRALGYSEEKIEDIFRITKPWGRQDHIHVLCTGDPKSDNFKLYYRVMFFYGIHHNDLKRLEPTSDELIWALRQSTKWSTVDKGLCWNCGSNPYEVEMNGVLYCRKCAHEIIEERAGNIESE